MEFFKKPNIYRVKGSIMAMADIMKEVQKAALEDDYAALSVYMEFLKQGCAQVFEDCTKIAVMQMIAGKVPIDKQAEKAGLKVKEALDNALTTIKGE